MSQKQDNNPPPPTFGMAFTEEIAPPPPAERRPILQTLTQPGYSFLNGLYTRPNYIDMSWLLPGAMVVGVHPFTYQCPPDRQVKPLSFTAWVNLPPTGGPLNFTVSRSAYAGDAATPPIAAATLATATVLAGVNNALFTIVDADNYTIPGTVIYVTVTLVGTVTPGEDLMLTVRG